MTITRFSADGAAASPASTFFERKDAHSSLSRAGVVGLEVGYETAVIGGDLRFGVSLHRRTGYRFESGTRFDQSKQIADGLGFVDSSGRSHADTKITNTSLMLNVYYDGRVMAPALFGAYPWIGIGIGWSRNHVARQTVAYSGSLQIDTPSGMTDLRLGNGELNVAEGVFDGLAWQVMAGASWDLAPQWVVSIGYRYAQLGKYQFLREPRYSKVAASGESLRADFPADTYSLDMHEVFLNLRHRF